jgi:hypothetical protein
MLSRERERQAKIGQDINIVRFIGEAGTIELLRFFMLAEQILCNAKPIVNPRVFRRCCQALS